MQNDLVGVWLSLVDSRRLPRKVSGLYVFRNTLNQKLYVGMSNDIRHRINVHRRAESEGALLHRALRKYGPEVFEVCLYLRADFAELPELERMLIAELGCLVPAGYNLTEGGEGNLGWVMGEAQKEQLRIRQTGKKMSDATKAKMAEINKNLWTPEMRELAGEFSRMKVMSAEGKAGVAAANKSRHQGWRDKVGAINKGRVGALNHNSKQIGMWPPGSMTPWTFESTVQAAEWLNCYPSRISQYCLGKFTPRDKSVWAYL